MGCDASLCECLQAKCTKRNGDTACLWLNTTCASATTVLPLAIFCFLWCQHIDVLFMVSVVELCVLAGWALFLFLFEDIAAVNPYFDTDDSVREVCFLACKVDVGTERLKRYAATFDFLGARHFCSSETTGDTDADSLHVAVGHDLLDCLLQNASECLALLETFGNHVGDNRGLALW